jgi:hypothetical protein
MSALMAEPVRRSPYELVFVEGGHEAALDAIAGEAEARGVDPADPERFLLLEAAGTLLRDLRPDSESPAAIARYGALLYHAFHFRRAGHPLFTIEEAPLRALLTEPPTIGAWRLRGPARAGYLQLPRNLVWAPGEQDDSPEPIDGFFWTFAPALSKPDDRLQLAFILGMRPDRAGFGIIEAAADLPPEPVAHWADIQARETGEDFANVLPGGEIQKLFALTSFGEALRLASLVLHAGTESVGAEERETADASASPHALPPTKLVFRRIGTDVNG